MAVAPRTPLSMRLAEFSDRELLYVVLDLTDPQSDGYVGVDTVVKRVGLKHKNSLQCVSVRFAYMARKMGVIERNPVRALRYNWRLTELGIAYVKGAKLTKAQEQQINEMGEERLLALTSTLSRRYREASPEGGVLIRREWQYGLVHRNGV